MSVDTISFNTFFSDTLNITDSIILSYTQTAYSQFISYYQTTLTIVLTVYVMFIGCRILLRIEILDAMTVTRRLMMMLVVWGLVMEWNLFSTLVYNVFTKEPGNIAQILVQASGHFASGGSVNSALDTFFSTLVNAVENYLKHAGFSTAGVCFIAYAVLVIICGLPMTVIALLLFVGAKIAMALFLALAPLFIVCVLFDATRNLFSSWISMLLTFALIPIITSGILAIILTLINVVLPSVNAPPESQNFASIAMFCVFSVGAAWLLKHVYQISSSLAGGVTLSQFSSHVRGSVGNVGSAAWSSFKFANKGAGKAGGWAGRGVRKAKDFIAMRRYVSSMRNAFRSGHGMSKTNSLVSANKSNDE